MRVIAGTARSLPLKTLPSDSIRPTTDKTKETLFNILMPVIPGCRFLDLFAGTGAIGIEALSRGALCAVFVESSRPAQKIIEENLAFTHLGEHAVLMKTDVRSAVKRLGNDGPFDIIFMDPPYRKGLESEALELLASSRAVSPETILVAETSNDTELSEGTLAAFEITRQKIYKTNRHIFLRRRSS